MVESDNRKKKNKENFIAREKESQNLVIGL